MAEPRPLRLARFERLAPVVFVVATLLQAAVILRQPATFQWDLVAYARGVSLSAAGLNPYDATLVIAPPAGSEVTGAGHLPFVYPPHTLLLFRILFAGGFRAAYVAFLVVKVTLLFGAARAWTLGWIRREDRALFPLFALAAFNGCASVDLAAGNVATYEAFFLALGFIFFVRGRRWAFAACVLAASVFKLAPLGLLVALAFERRRDGARALAVTTGVVFALACIAVAVAPTLHHAFFDAVTGLTGSAHERAFQNPSSREFAGDVGVVLASQAGAARRIGSASYLAWVCVVALVSAGALVRRARIAAVTDEELRRYVLTVACLAYAVTAPRFKDYSFLIVVAPFVAALASAGATPRARHLRVALLTLALVPSDAIASALSEHAVASCPRTFAWLALGYLPMLTVAAAWAVAVGSSASGARRGRPAGGTNVDIPRDALGEAR